MKQIELKEGITVAELQEKFLKQTKALMPGEWKFVGIEFYLINEETDVLATPGVYSKDFNKDEYLGVPGVTEKDLNEESG
jgi:hypothetical protein